MASSMADPDSRRAERRGGDVAKHIVICWTYMCHVSKAAWQTFLEWLRGEVCLVLRVEVCKISGFELTSWGRGKMDFSLYDSRRELRAY